MRTGRAEHTRALLQACALELVERKGFDATTVEEIARAAGVSHMTFFRYFPTKESVLLDDLCDPMIVQMVVEQDPGQRPLEQVCGGFLAAWSALPEPADAGLRARIRILAGHRDLRAAAWRNSQGTEDLLVDVLTSRGVPMLEARVATGACLGALMSALLYWGTADDGIPLGVVVTSALKQLLPPDHGQPT